jgi:hypothetical protein
LELCRAGGEVRINPPRMGRRFPERRLALSQTAVKSAVWRHGDL